MITKEMEDTIAEIEAEEYRLVWLAPDGDAVMDGGEFYCEPGDKEIKAFVRELLGLCEDDDSMTEILDGRIRWYRYRGDWNRGPEDLGRSGDFEPREYWIL